MDDTHRRLALVGFGFGLVILAECCRTVDALQPSAAAAAGLWLRIAEVSLHMGALTCTASAPARRQRPGGVQTSAKPGRWCSWVVAREPTACFKALPTRPWGWAARSGRPMR